MLAQPGTVKWINTKGFVQQTPLRRGLFFCVRAFCDKNKKNKISYNNRPTYLNYQMDALI